MICRVRWTFAIAVILVVAGCQTAQTPGSLYRQTGRIVDLLAEPTFDVGADPAAVKFYSFRVPHNDADGHGLFDVPMVFCEQLMFAPTWAFSAGLSLTGSEPYVGAPAPPGIGPLVRKGAGWTFAAPGMVSYFAGLTGAMGFDIAAHDAPVIVIGRPLRWLGSL
jgi:hypothetical protein